MREARLGDVPGDLALAQRRLYQIAGYPHAARRTLGEVERWLECQAPD